MNGKTIYFKSPGGGLLIKTLGEDRPEIELDTCNMELQFTVRGIGQAWFHKEGYRPIDRAEFDEAYKKIVDNLNKFSSL